MIDAAFHRQTLYVEIWAASPPYAPGDKPGHYARHVFTTPDELAAFLRRLTTLALLAGLSTPLLAGKT